MDANASPIEEVELPNPEYCNEGCGQEVPAYGDNCDQCSVELADREYAMRGYGAW